MSKSKATVKGKEGIDRRLRSELMALSSASGLLGPIGTVASILLDCFDAIKSQQDYEDLATDLAQLSESLVKRFGENTSNTMFGSVAGISKQMADEAMDVKNKTQHGVSTGRSLIEESDEDELMRHCRRIQSLFRQLPIDLSAGTWSIADEILIVRTCTSGRFATKPVESQNSDLAGEAGATEKQHDYKDSTTDLAVSVESATEYFKQEGSYRRFRYISEIAKVIENEAARMKISMGPDALIRGPATAKLDEEEVMQHYRRICSLFQQLKSELNAATWCMGNEMMVSTRAQQLYPASEAVFDSAISSDIGRRTCTEGTRTQVLDDLAKWASDPDAPSVFWMNGVAGTGKTTIATTFSQRLEHNDLLVASFFCTRNSAECQDVNRIVPTIAYQLARYSPSFQRGLCDSLGVDPRTRSGITEEFELLLTGPLQEMDKAKIRSQVVVIDGLDECKDREVIGEILEMTFRYASQLPIKFFVTSRPIPEIVRIMGAHPGSSTVMLLHDIETLLVSADIELCLREGLASISPDVSDAVIKLLVEKSGVLFIYAAVLLRLHAPAGANRLIQCIWGYDNQPQEPIHAETIAILSNTNDHRRVEHALSLLLPIIRYSESTRLASTLHMSLQEFVFDQKRSGEYFCNVVEQIPVLARRCFQVMEDQLRMNICDLPSSFVPDDKVEDLQDRIEKNISPALAYVCRNWANHLRLAPQSDEFATTLGDFLSHRLLFWIEVLNLRGELSVGVAALLTAKKWLASLDTASSRRGLSILIEDSTKFIMDYASTLASQSTPHIYISALALCPGRSTVYTNYWGRARGLLELRGSLMERREMAGVVAAATWNTTSSVITLAYSPDGSRVAVGCDDGTVSIRDAYDGTQLTEPLRGHIHRVNSVIFSSDGRHIASGSADCTIQRWDPLNGTLIGSPMKHTEAVVSVSYSPDNQHIASGSSDKVWVWDVSNGTLLLGPLEGHGGLVNFVSFSPDGTLIASASADHTMQLWRFPDGTPASSPLQGHTGGVTYAVFTPDGSRLVSASYDGTIRTWNVLDGSPIGLLCQDIGPITSMALSPDGGSIASVTKWGMQIWRVGGEMLVTGPLVGSAGPVKYSLDGTQLISCSLDTVRLWNVREGVLPIPTPSRRFPYPVVSSSFLPDGTCVSLGSGSTNQIYDLSDGTCQVDLNYVAPLASSPSHDSSPDGSYISNTSDGTLRRIFSHDSRSIIMGFVDGVVQVQSLEDERHITRLLTTHMNSVQSIAQSPDGSLVASIKNERFVGQSLRISNLLLLLLNLQCSDDRDSTSIETYVNPDIYAGWHSREDGWVVNKNGDLLFWFPPDIPSGLTPHTSIVITQFGTLFVPKQNLCIGDQWSRCYIVD
ncbi:peptidase C14 [Rhizoctonia solani]|uniref:Peptidase C14 n=1 Tax=Rhizoctonia solani TaxID=456999 RepID=A0A8H8NU02_9AGAM|nr:peptidase C14 [Rhizoctonia solani]QRW18727.1 peptidase C14 [Rhizoctonia solani]